MLLPALSGASLTLCISISSRPGRLGVTVHNAGYRELGLPYVYVACRVIDLEGAIAGVRALGIRGCSVSMPFKEAVIPLLDRIDPLAADVGAVNTIVNDAGELVGYNTDVAGARGCLETLDPRSQDRTLILGAGGAARAVIHALRELNVRTICVTARNESAAAMLSERFGITALPWSRRHEFEGDLLINATPVGMCPESDGLPIRVEELDCYRMALDVVAAPRPTALIASLRRSGIAVAEGQSMSLHQAYEQFQLYTGVAAPVEAMRKAAEVLRDT